MERLSRSSASSPGITRRPRGKGFEYFEEEGTRVADREVLGRIRELGIPPAWKEVWVCPYPMGHLQATGVDARGRTQYLYHRSWRERRDQAKFDSMVEFAHALPGMRATVGHHLASTGMSRERVLACALRLLDRGFFRVGGESYAVENETYGLATMHKRHVSLEERAIVFDYVAKSGKRRIQSIVDAQVYEIVATLKRRRGGNPELLAYKRGRQWVDIKSADVNEYLKELTGGDFSAKDFRTWNATLIAAQALAVSGLAAGGPPTRRKRAVTRAVKEVASYLGNTPAVARASYIDPRLFDRFESGVTIGGVLELLVVGDEGDVADFHGQTEQAVLALLADDYQAPGVEQADELEALAAAG